MVILGLSGIGGGMELINNQNMRTLFKIILILISQISYSQNLIQNGGFEKYHESFLSITLVKNAKYWKIPNNSTPDLLTPNNNFELINYGKKGLANERPYRGMSCVGIIVFSIQDDMWNYREFVTNKLKSPLIKDSLYYLSMYVYLGEESTLVTNGIESYFSNEYEIIDTNYSDFDKRYITNTGNGDFLYKREWVKICGIYQANGDERYITIGNFQKLKHIQYYRSNARVNSDIGNSSYIFIDDISLIPIHDSSQCDCKIKRISVENLQNNSISDDERNSVVSREGTIISLKDLYFNTDSYEIMPKSFEELDKLYALLSSNPNLKISVNGYTDNVGSIKYNLRLSEQRAKAVVDYLIVKGISKERLKYQGYGEVNPIQTNETQEGRAVNRRVEVEFLKEEI